MNMEQEYSYLKGQHQTRTAEWKSDLIRGLSSISEVFEGWMASPWMHSHFFLHLKSVHFQCDLIKPKDQHPAFQRRCCPRWRGWPRWWQGGEVLWWQPLQGEPWPLAVLSRGVAGKCLYGREEWVIIQIYYHFLLRTYREPVVPAPSRNFTIAWVRISFKTLPFYFDFTPRFSCLGFGGGSFMGFSQSRLIFSPFGTTIQVGVFCSEHLFYCSSFLQNLRSGLTRSLVFPLMTSE